MIIERIFPWADSAVKLIRGIRLLLLAIFLLSAKGLWADGHKRVFVVDTKHGDRTGEIIVVDPEKGEVVRRIEVGNSPNVCPSPDGSVLYISESRMKAEGSWEDRLVAYTTKDFRMLSTAPLTSRLAYTVFPQQEAVQCTRDRVFVVEMATPPPKVGPQAGVEYEQGPVSSRITVFKTRPRLEKEFTVPTGFGTLVSVGEKQPIIVLDRIRNTSRLMFVDPSTPAKPRALILSEEGVPKQPQIPVQLMAAISLTPRRVVGGDLKSLRTLELSDNLERVLSSKTLIEQKERQIATWTLSKDSSGRYVGVGSFDPLKGAVRDYRVFQASDWKAIANIVFPTESEVLDATLSSDGRFVYATDAIKGRLFVYELTRLPDPVRIISGIDRFPAQVVVPLVPR